MTGIGLALALLGAARVTADDGASGMVWNKFEDATLSFLLPVSWETALIAGNSESAKPVVYEMIPMGESTLFRTSEAGFTWTITPSSPFFSPSRYYEGFMHVVPHSTEEFRDEMRIAQAAEARKDRAATYVSRPQIVPVRGGRCWYVLEERLLKKERVGRDGEEVVKTFTAHAYGECVSDRRLHIALHNRLGEPYEGSMQLGTKHKRALYYFRRRVASLIFRGATPELDLDDGERPPRKERD